MYNHLVKKHWFLLIFLFVFVPGSLPGLCFVLARLFIAKSEDSFYSSTRHVSHTFCAAAISHYCKLYCYKISFLPPPPFSFSRALSFCCTTASLFSILSSDWSVDKVFSGWTVTPAVNKYNPKILTHRGLQWVGG